MELKQIINEFKIEGKVDCLEEIKQGLINTTYLIQTNQEKYLIQKINTTIFKNITGIMRNIEIVNAHLKKNNYRYKLLEIVKTRSKANIFYDSLKNPWRCYKYIEHKKCTFKDLNKRVVCEFGKAIGHFHACLYNLNPINISNTIINFHNTENYFNRLRDLVDKGETKRVEDVRSSLVFIDQFSSKFKRINKLIQSRKLPIRVCHNDPKIDNILFKKNNNIASIIDLDTLMENSIIYDFGDAIRTSCNKKIKFDTRIDKIDFEFNLFKSFSEGYAIESKAFICKVEKDLLSFSPILVTLEQAIRFLIDYLNLDSYYKINYPRENLKRGLSQIALAKKMLSKEQEMESYINSLF